MVEMNIKRNYSAGVKILGSIPFNNSTKAIDSLKIDALFQPKLDRLVHNLGLVRANDVHCTMSADNHSDNRASNGHDIILHRNEAICLSSSLHPGLAFHGQTDKSILAMKRYAVTAVSH